MKDIRQIKTSAYISANRNIEEFHMLKLKQKQSANNFSFLFVLFTKKINDLYLICCLLRKKIKFKQF